MKIQSLLLAASLLLSTAVVSFAQSVDEVVNTYIETIGGAEKWKSIESMRVSGNAVQMGANYPFTVISMKPNLSKVVANVMGKEFIQAYDGEAGWALNPFNGGTAPTRMTEEESKESAKQNFENDFIDWREKGYTVTLEENQEIEGAQCFVLKIVKEEGSEEYYFIDAEAYVPIMTRSFMQTGPMKGQAMETYYSDYDEVDGLIVPFSMKQTITGQTIMEMVNEKYEFNPKDVTAESFAFPKE